MLQWFYLLIVYPCYTIWFASHASILNENLSYVGNLEHLHWAFILWGVCTILALAQGIQICIKHSLFKNRNQWITFLSACLLVLAVTLPYRPADYPFLSFVHILLSFAAPLSLLVAVLMIFMDLKMIYPTLMKYCLTIYSLICIISIGIYFKYASVNTLVEIFIAISVSILLQFTAMKLTKMSNKEK